MRKPQHRHCEGPCCGRGFGPRQRNQRYCQPSCQAAADLRRLNGDADTLAQISAKMLNEAFYSYNKPRKVLIKKNEEPAPARMPSTPEELGCSEDKSQTRIAPIEGHPGEAGQSKSLAR